jgi:hypothetical protein
MKENVMHAWAPPERERYSPANPLDCFAIPLDQAFELLFLGLTVCRTDRDTDWLRAGPISPDSRTPAA